MEKIYQIFISATKKNMEVERINLINSLLLQNCYPVTMEYFISSHEISTLKACLNAIDRSDAVILLLKDNYGEKISKVMIESSFIKGCPFKEKGLCKCNSGKYCNYSFTHFEYKYSFLKKKIIYVLFHNSLLIRNNNSIELENFKKDTNINGSYNVYDDNDFDSISSAVISKIKNDCKERKNFGLIKVDNCSETCSLKNRISLFEKNIFDGLEPIKNYMGCIIKEDDLIFYVYKESKLLREKHGFDFSIHINTDQNEDFKGKLTREMIDAHAYVRYTHAQGFKEFTECIIQEKSYGKEYLNCHIEFAKKSGVKLPIVRNTTIGVLYTYHVNKNLYGNEIGRKTSPFLEDTVVELRYPDSQPHTFECFEKRDNDLIILDDNGIQNSKQSDNSFLDSILSESKMKIEDIFSIYDKNINFRNLKTITINVPTHSIDGNAQTIHFYVRWEKI